MVQEQTEYQPGLVQIMSEQPWRYKKKDGTWSKIALQLTQKEVFAQENIKVYFYLYENACAKITAQRTVLKIGKQITFVIDDTVTGEPVSVYADFKLENTDAKTWCNVADKHKIVARNDEIAVKHFRLMSAVDDAVLMDKAGLLMPAQIYEDFSVGYSMYEGLYCFGQKHFTCYGFCADKPENIDKWHFIQTQEEIQISDKEEIWCLKLDEKTVKVFHKQSSAESIWVDRKNRKLIKQGEMIFE